MNNDMQAKKFSNGYRFLSGLAALLSLIAILGVISYTNIEDITLTYILIITLPFAGLYIFFPIAIRGHPPKPLSWVVRNL